MGTDINLYAEICINGKWEPTLEPTWTKGKKILTPDNIRLLDGRPYELFAALAGITQDDLRRTMYAVVEPIAQPRGFPDDMNDLYKNYFPEKEYPNCYGFSWLLLKEVIDYDWDGQFVTQWAYVKSEYAKLFQNSCLFPHDFPEEEKLYYNFPNCEKEPDTLEVSWITSYRDYVGCSEAFISELLKLGSPDEIRIIFWFDC